MVVCWVEGITISRYSASSALSVGDWARAFVVERRDLREGGSLFGPVPRGGLALRSACRDWEEEA
eukprot:scaffold301_cov243-Pinguiococcus_pyrenoidosus.AAC.108